MNSNNNNLSNMDGLTNKLPYKNTRSKLGEVSAQYLIGRKVLII